MEEKRTKLQTRLTAPNGEKEVGTPLSVSDPGSCPVRLEQVEATQLEKERKDKKKKKKKDKGIGSERGIETMFRTSYRQHVDLSALADNKANIMITINGIIISFVLASISPKIDANPWLLIPTSVLLIGCLVSIVNAIQAARPRISRKLEARPGQRGRNTSILFFNNFVGLSEDEYLTSMSELLQDTDRLYRDMMVDIYNLGHVLAFKFRYLRYSYTTFTIALTVGVILYITVFIMTVNSSVVQVPNSVIP